MRDSCILSLPLGCLVRVLTSVSVARSEVNAYIEPMLLSSPLLFDLTFSILITLQKVLKYDSAQNASDARRRNRLKGQRAIVINPFQLSASGFQLLCNAADGVFSAESILLLLSGTEKVDAVGIETDVDFLICLEILFGSQDKDVATLCADV